MKKLLNFIKDLFFKPSTKIGLGILIGIGFIAGAVSWQKLNDVLDETSTEEFCVSCHSMQTPLKELQETAHWSNNSGVTATCSSCHLPHDKTAKYARKVQASREIYAELIGKYDDENAFEKHRLEMAEREWERFAANGSKECKACHSYDRMKFETMSPAAQKAMIPAAERDQSCMDCHRGIAHHLPKKSEQDDMLKSKFEELVVNKPVSKVRYYTKANVNMFSDEAMTNDIGQLETSAPITMISSGKNADLVELEMWRKEKGFGRVWYDQFGINIVNAIFSKEYMQNEPKFEVIETREDEITGLIWQKVKLQVWIAKSQLISDIDAVWTHSESIYKAQCSTCHRQPDVDHFDANTWIGLFNGMVGFTNIDKQTGKEVLRYLQLHSSDFETHHTENEK